MIGARWRGRIGAPSIALGICLLLTATIPAAFAVSGRPAAGRGVVCAGTPANVARAVQRERTDVRVRTRVSNHLADDGTMTGQTLVVERTGRAPTTFSLPVESFIGARSGDALVYTRSGGGRGSEVHLVDMATGCDTIIARPVQIVRSAIVDRGGSAVYVHSVTRAGRRDAGVERHDLTTGSVTSVLPALDAPAWLDRVFGTELRWTVGGSSLVVQSCGFARCLSRFVHIASGRISTIDAPGQGALIGATDSTLVTFATCPGVPCAVIAWDVPTGAAATLADEAFEARLLPTPDGTIVSITTATGTREVSL